MIMPAGRVPYHYLYPSKIYGVFIGVNKFEKKNSFSGIADLGGCVNDATGMYNVFKDKGDCKLLVDEKATRVNILAAFTDYIGKAQKDDLFIMQVSSHGAVKHDDCYFLPHDSDGRNIMGTGIAAAPIINAMSEKAKKGVKAVLILDACDSGAVSFNIAKYRGIAKGGISCIFGCSPNEKAMEAKFKDENLKDKLYGVMAYAMIRALNGEVEEIKNKGHVNLRDLFDYSYRFVTVDFNKGSQHPVLIGTLDGRTILKKLG